MRYGLIWLLLWMAAVAMMPVGIAQATQVTAGAGQIFTQGATVSPGVAFFLDYRALFAGVPASPPLDVLDVQVGFDSLGPSYSALNLQLDTAPTQIVSIAPLNGSQISHVFYDPTSIDPATIIGPSKSLITQAWRDEGRDGVISGRWWLSNLAHASSFYQLTMQMTVELPEPSGIGASLVAMSALTGMRLRRRRRCRLTVSQH